VFAHQPHTGQPAHKILVARSAPDLDVVVEGSEGARCTRDGGYPLVRPEVFAKVQFSETFTLNID
jgi:hypothetical protein